MNRLLKFLTKETCLKLNEIQLFVFNSTSLKFQEEKSIEALDADLHLFAQ